MELKRVGHYWVTTLSLLMHFKGLPGGASGKEPTGQFRQCKRHGFNPWVEQIPWRRASQPTPVFLPGESPWTEEPGRLQSTGWQRVRYNWVSTVQHKIWRKANVPWYYDQRPVSLDCELHKCYIVLFSQLNWGRKIPVKMGEVLFL